MELSLRWYHPTVPRGESSLNHLSVSIQTPAVSGREQRPLAIAFVLDKSWSMKGDKLVSTIEAVSSFINWMTRQDYVSIIAYAQDVQTVQSISALTEKKSVIRRLQGIEPGTSTNLSGGWLEGLHSLEDSILPQSAIRRVILLTDGIATMGIEDEERLAAIAAEYASRGITTTTIGIGDDFHESSLLNIAKAGMGNFYYISSPEQTSDIFFREFGSIGAVIAQSAHLELTLSEGLRYREILDALPARRAGNSVLVPLGDLRSSDEKQILFTFEHEDQATVSARLTWFPVSGNAISESVSASTSVQTGEETTDKTVERELMIAWTGIALLDASRVAETDPESAHDILRNISERLAGVKTDHGNLCDYLLARITTMAEHLRRKETTHAKTLLASGAAFFQEREKLFREEFRKGQKNILEYVLPGELDMYNAPDFRNAMALKIENGVTDIIVEMSGSPFVDSSGIGTLIQISNWLARRGGILVVTNLSPALEKIFAIAQLGKFIGIAESSTDARMMIESGQAGA